MLTTLSSRFFFVMLWLVSTHFRRHAVRAFSTTTILSRHLQQQQQAQLRSFAFSTKATVYDEDLDSAIDEILGSVEPAHIQGSKPMRTDLVATEEVRVAVLL
jgi:hypothetical protein